MINFVVKFYVIYINNFNDVQLILDKITMSVKRD